MLHAASKYHPVEKQRICSLLWTGDLLSVDQARFRRGDQVTAHSASRSPMVLVTLHSSGSHHTSVDAYSMTQRLWPLQSRLQCCLEYPRVRSSDLSFLYSTQQMYTTACERPRAFASCIRGWHADSRGMSSFRDRWAATPCICLPGRCVVVDGS